MKKSFERVFRTLRDAIGSNVTINQEDTNEDVLCIDIRYKDAARITVRTENTKVEGATHYIYLGYDDEGVTISTTLDGWTHITIKGDNDDPFVVCTDLHGYFAKIRVGGAEIIIPRGDYDAEDGD